MKTRFMKSIILIFLVTFTAPLASAAGLVRGLFIGSFGPITNAHVDVIRAGITQLGLQEVVIVVNSASGKDYSASTVQRILLVQAALKSDLPPEVRYHVINEPPEGKRAFAISLANGAKDGVLLQIAGDDVQSKAKELFGDLTQVKSYIVPRIGENGQVGEILPGFNELNVTSPSSVSSTEVKRLRLSGRSIRGMVPASVLSMIESMSLYRPLSARALRTRHELIAAQVDLLLRSAKRASPAIQHLNFSKLEEVAKAPVEGGISTETNLELNPLQSQAAVEELLARRLVAGNPGLMTYSSHLVRQWVESVLRGPEGRALKLKIVGGRCEALFI